MTTISIVPEPPARFRAVAGEYQSVGATPGEALDAIAANLANQESGTLIVVQQMRPDRFFGETEQKRLAELMDLWRSARDRDETLPVAVQVELEELIAAELSASAERAAAPLGGSRS
jgi:hypothetical protein